MKSYRHIIYNIAILLLPVVLGACSQPGHRPLDVDAMVTYIPVQTQPEGRWGMMSTSGRLLFEDEFVTPPSLAINGVFSAAEENGYALYATGDQPRLIADCEALQSAGYLNDGLIPISRPGERITIVGADGTPHFVLDPINNKEIVSVAPMYSDGLLVVTDADGLCGCVNVRGETVIVPKYTAIHDFSDGYAIAQEADGTYAIIDRTGNVACDVNPRYQVVSTQVKHDAVVVTDTAAHIGFMSLAGEVSRLPGKVKAVGDYTPAIFSFLADNGLWGLMARRGANEMLMRPKFKSITLLPEIEAYLVNLDNTWAIINIQGKKIIDFGDKYTEVVAPGYKSKIKYLAKDNAGWVLLDEAGKEIHTNYEIYGIAYNLSRDAATSSATLAPKVTPESLVQAVTAQITPNSLCGIQLNAIANRWYSKQAPADMVDTKEFTPDSIPDLKAAGEASVIGVTDRLISVAMRFNTQTQSIEYAFMPSNTMAAIELDLITPLPDVFSQTKALWIDAIKPLGYRLVDEGDDVISFRSPYANLEISTEEDNKAITILMFRL